MINFILKLWFKIPHIKFRNPFIFQKRDKRELEWFKERRKYGFDERTLWGLNSVINDKVMAWHGYSFYDNRPDDHFCDIEEFKQWFIGCQKKDLKWVYDRIDRYVNWNCPTFFIKPGGFTDKGSIYIDDKESKLILQECLILINNRINNENKPGDPEYLFKYIFTLGW